MRESSISTKQLHQGLGRPDWLVLDVRNPAAYNGWPLTGEERGGHISGAVSVPLGWMDRLSEPGVADLLARKGFVAGMTFVVYGYGAADAAAMARYLRSIGYDRVLTYKAGLAAWAAEGNLPMDRLARYKKLVDADWICQRLQGQPPATGGEGDFLLFEVGSGASQAYDRGHIPRAVYLDTSSLEAEPLWNRVPAHVLEATLLRHGISHETRVVLYGKDMTAAARAAVILLYAGVEDVRFLDGGFDAWMDAGYSTERTERVPMATPSFGTQVPARPEYIIDAKQVRALLTEEDAVLVSVRSWPEYVGETSGYDYIEPRGRIAGAVWGCAGRTPLSMGCFRNVDNTMRSYTEIVANWTSMGITRAKKVCFYCGTGWRASEAFLYAYWMGWERISVYDGGWYEWSADPSNPIECGPPGASLLANVAGERPILDKTA